MDYSNYIKEHPNSLIITNTEEEFVDIGTKLGWSKSQCKDRWQAYKKEDDNSILCIDGSLQYSPKELYFNKEKKYENFKRISYSEFLGTTDDYQIY